MTSLTGTGVWGRMGALLGKRGTDGAAGSVAPLLQETTESAILTTAPVTGQHSSPRGATTTGAALRSTTGNEVPERGCNHPGHGSESETRMSTRSIASDGWRVPTNRRHA